MDQQAVREAVDEMGALLRSDGADLQLVEADPKTARIELRLEPAHCRIHFLLRGLRFAGRRHQSAPQLADGLLPDARVGAQLIEGQRVEGHPSGPVGGVVAGGAVLLQEVRHRRGRGGPGPAGANQRPKTQRCREAITTYACQRTSPDRPVAVPKSSLDQCSSCSFCQTDAGVNQIGQAGGGSHRPLRYADRRSGRGGNAIDGGPA